MILDVVDEPWRQGTYEMELAAEGLSLKCSLLVVEDGVPPSDFNIQCEGDAIFASSLYDTGSFGVDDIYFKVPLTADSPPGEALLTSRWTSAPGAVPQLSIQTLNLSWAPSLPTSASGCEFPCITTRVSGVLRSDR